jgi:REP element-mobilizing transposase RayT
MAMVKKRSKVEQLELCMPTWGGRREGAGRKRVAPRPSVPHVVRAEIKAWNPVIITIRFRDDVPDLRERPRWVAIVRTLRKFRGRYPLRIVHFTVLVNHMHLLSEADGRLAIARGMQAFCVRLAKRLNACFGRRGPVFAGRYHVRELKTPREVWLAIRYVLLNARHHGISLPPGSVDTRSSAASFDGWRDPPRMPQRNADFGTSPAQSWLLRVGWRKHGPIDLDDIPGATKPAARAKPESLPIQEGVTMTCQSASHGRSIPSSP